MTVPVYEYVLMTKPPQGIGDSANQFHYYRLSADDRILFGSLGVGASPPT